MAGIFATLLYCSMCSSRFLQPGGRKAGGWVSNRLTKWINSHFSERQQRRISRIAFGSLIAACLVLGMAVSKMDHQPQPPVPEAPAFADAPTAAAIRFSTGRIISGDADISAGQEQGVFSVRFKDQQRGHK